MCRSPLNAMGKILKIYTCTLLANNAILFSSTSAFSIRRHMFLKITLPLHWHRLRHRHRLVCHIYRNMQDIYKYLSASVFHCTVRICGAWNFLSLIKEKFNSISAPWYGICLSLLLLSYLRCNKSNIAAMLKRQQQQQPQQHQHQKSVNTLTTSIFNL